MKPYRLVHHQRSVYNEDLLLNPKEHPNIKKGDIVEIFHQDENDDKGRQRCRLLLQVSLTKDTQGRNDYISVESSIALTFNLKNYGDVFMQVVNPASVALDSVEITFKDQYMGRSEMWRLKQYLTNTCVYINKKIEYCDSIRCQVYEMWSFGERVSCGVITEDTKVVFRSSTSMVYLFMQMSSEMWDFDIHGDLYFEKAVNGFLTDLFAKWKKQGSNHEVTIVLFSRTFYAAKSLEEFPEHMRDCLQMDYKNRFYEDFYRVAVQNERNDDWSTILVQLRRLFTSYKDIVLKYHERPGIVVPVATNSTAAQGNFLEVLNISLNVFEKHYLDRSFDRTGQLSVVITPGVGVFEVDRELTNITKQRIIDNGVGSDLVCVGEQPLHAVPLLKFHNKDPSLNSVDDYSMPHWINLSFYSTNKKVAYSTFIPRIKLPPQIRKNESADCESAEVQHVKRLKDEINFYTDANTEYIHNSLFDYDAYDAQVFAFPSHGALVQRTVRAKKSSAPSYSVSMTDGGGGGGDSAKFQRRRKMSDPDIHYTSSDAVPATVAGGLRESLSQSTLSASKSRRSLPIRTGRALINPFDPSHVTIKLTSNRRRWSHIFPKGPTGVLIQQHHYQALPSKPLPPLEHELTRDDSFSLANCDDYMHTAMCQHHHNNSSIIGNGGVNCGSNGCMTNGSVVTINGGGSGNMGRRQHSSLSTRSFERFEDEFGRLSASNTPVDRGSFLNDSSFLKTRKAMALNSTPFGAPTTTSTPSKTLLWGATGEQSWTPQLTTGVDWKSLTIPACLPITTDYFPDKRSLNNDYVLSIYTLLPDDVNADFMRLRAVQRRPLSTEEVFKELVSQRLAQGFQLIILPDAQQTQSKPATAPCCGGSILMKSSVVAPVVVEQPKEYVLSIGRIFHKITLNDKEIKITRYRPRHPYPPINVDYRYRFHAPNHDTYEVSGVNFTTEKLENFNWNHMDQYICTRGDFDFMLLESMKYWRYRMYLLPKDDPVMRRIMDENIEHCDIYMQEMTPAAQKQQIEEFLRLVETHLNKIKRVKKPRGSPTTSHLTRRRHSTSTSIHSRPPAVNQNQALQNSPFRERVGSNRFPERLRPSSNVSMNRSGSKIETRSALMQLQASMAEKNAKNGADSNADDNDDCFAPDPPKFKPTSPISEIFEAFRNPNTGVGFLEPLPSMPSLAFSSYDAIMWLYRHVEGVANPLEILEVMREQRLICHASGDPKMPVVSGFYMYYVVPQDTSSSDFRPPLGDQEAFSFEWMEVEVPMALIAPRAPVVPAATGTTATTPNESDVPTFLKEEIERRNLDGKLYKHSHLEVDLAQKSDRTEWGHARYHKHFVPGRAFEIGVQWLVASGPILYDLIYNWSRKATQCGFQLMPIPCDPLAEPFSLFEKSDPLRGPIFVPLNLDCLHQSRANLFEDFKRETWTERLLLLQEEIAKRFGFVPRECETKTGSNDITPDWQYIHTSGNMFVVITSSTHKVKNTLRRLGMGNGSHSSPTDSLKSQKRLKNYYHVQQQQNTAPQKENYINRHVQSNASSASRDSDDEGFGGVQRKHPIGFLWQWNHMIANKKWKSLTVGGTDELFQLRMLRDFRAFCANADGRLMRFWDEAWEKKEKLSLQLASN